MSVPESEWVWCGYAGHFIGSRSCLLHLHTRVGNYRISTVGDYHPSGVADPKDIGAGRKYETFVFHVQGEGSHGEGSVVDWGEIDSEGYNDAESAERGHMEMCRKYAGMPT